MTRLILIALLLGVSAAHADKQLPPGVEDGQVHLMADGSFVAWDSVNELWLVPEDFWRNFAGRERGRTWPAGMEFPPYDAVSEHDTFLYQSEQGACLMYFFHSRWRRANDVWRWGDEFNTYGSCPSVFD